MYEGDLASGTDYEYNMDFDRAMQESYTKSQNEKREIDYKKEKINMNSSTDEIAQRLIEKGIIRPVSTLSLEELYEYRQDLKDLIARLPEDEPEVITNFKEDLEDAEKAIKQFY